MTVDVVVQGSDTLGESPIWDERAGALYWVDGRAPGIYRWQGQGAPRFWPMPEVVGSIAFRHGGGLLVGLQSGIYTFDLETQALVAIAKPEEDRPETRFNDGRCDRRGRFWSGTMSAATREPLGTLYRLSPDGTCTPQFSDIIVPNGIAWSPDDERMYFADTYRQLIWTFDYDIVSGEISNRRLFSDNTDRPGRPDGSAVDSAGCLWNCEYAGGRVIRYTPDGAIDRIVDIPADNPTCCAFGGSDLRTLYITSARQRLTPEQLAAKPLAGSVFALRTDVAGLPEARFGA